MGVQVGCKIAVCIRVLVFVYCLLPTRLCAQESLYTANNTLFNINDTSTYVLILKNEKNCLVCFTELSQALSSNIKGSQGVIASVSQVDSSVFARKSEINNIKKIMPTVSLTLFEYRKYTMPNEIVVGSVFSRYNVEITPAIVLINRGKRYYYSYDEIYVGKKINNVLVSEIQKLIEHNN